MKQVVEMGKMVESMQKMVDLVSDNVKSMQSDVNYLKQENSELQNNVKVLRKDLQNTNHTALSALEKVSLRDENEFGEEWLCQKDLGLTFEPAISSHQIGNVLKSTGLAMKNRSRTTPMMRTISNGHVRRGYAKNYSSWYWYAPVFKDKFISYLKKKDLYEEFVTLRGDEDAREFMNLHFRKGTK